MKQFKVYKNIRKRAMIMGLPISLFALMMTSVLVSLLVIIFSFGFLTIIFVFVFNTTLYIALTQLAKNTSLLNLKRVFPQSISNKKLSPLNHEDN